MKTSAGFWVSLFGIAAATGCVPAAESFSALEVRDSAGVSIVHSHRPRWAGGDEWSVSSEPRLAIGVLSGRRDLQFVDIAAAARLSKGDLVVVDRGSRAVRLFDSAGGFLETLGGPGEGPGEFTDPGSVLVTSDDSVMVWDNALRRNTRFDSDGQLADRETVDLGMLIGALELELGGGVSGPDAKGKGGAPPKIGGDSEPLLYPGVMEPLANGGFLVRLIDKTGKSPPSGSFRPRSGVLRVSQDFSRVDTLALFGDTEQVTVDAPWGRFAVAPPHAKQTQITHQGNPSRICIGEQAGPQIECVSPDGSRTLVRWTSDPVPLTGEEIAAWREETVQLYDLKLSREQVLGMLEQVPLSGVRPAYSHIILDQLGYLWVERGRSVGGSPGFLDYLVFDPEGAWLGVVVLPPIRVLEIGHDYVLGVYEDEFEVQYLHQYDITR